MMTAFRLVLLASAVSHVAFAARQIQIHGATGSDANGETSMAMTCCCKEESCSTEAESKSGQPAIYSPDQGLCCRFQSSCNWELFKVGYYLEREEQFCVTPQVSHYREPEIPAALRPKEVSPDWKPEANTTAHLIDTYCSMDHHKLLNSEEAMDKDEKAVAAGVSRRNAIISELVQELSKNSLDSMAKEIFSIYTCIRWVPDPQFVNLAKDEIQTEQLPSDADPYKLYKKRSFIPLRCTRNINVYGDERSGETHFKYFESALNSLSDWLDSEADGAFQKRLVDMVKASSKDLPAMAKAFDKASIAGMVSKCPPDDDDSRGSVDVHKDTLEELMQNCVAMRWWLNKLNDWHTAFPFSSFMAPDAAAAKHAPEDDQQMLICFGKRVASDLHRRAGGNHLFTDQSAVGCHGFWNFAESAQMMRRTVWLWRPPTCQLAAMELDMKLKLMDAIADINAQLFDALPAMILDEKSQEPIREFGKPLEPAGKVKTLGKAAGDLARSISGAAGWLFGLNKAYQRLGLLLGNTVVKWAVCPLKSMDDREEEGRLDSQLGTEDDVARYFSQQAYAKWTGKKNAVPGEECKHVEGSPAYTAVPRCYECSLGLMQEKMPEPYGDEEFVCPVRPLMPAKQQLEVFQDKGPDVCFMHLTAAQYEAEEWLYKGHTPHLKQYNLTENHPTTGYESIRVMSWRRAPDSFFGIWRDWVTYARRCTEEEYAATPRWCKAPQVSSSAVSTAAKVLASTGGGLAMAGRGIANVVGKGHQLATGKESPPWNKAIGKRMMNWLYGVYKRAEGGSRGLIEKLVGRAGKRQEKLKERLFQEVEAGELLHSASFQKNLAKTGADSKDRQRLDRYAITCPCPGFKPEEEFQLKFKWGEHGLRILAEAEDILKGKFYEKSSVTVNLRGASILHMKDNENAWQSSFTFIRTGTTDWKKTTDPFLNQLVGIDQSSLSQKKVFGLSSTFACGTRKEMHDLSTVASEEQIVSMGGPSLKTCILDGVKKNKELKEASPNALFFADETVVRVTFSSLSDCYHEHFTGDRDKVVVPRPTTKPGEAPKPIWKEKDNALYQDFKGLGSDQGCEPASEEIKDRLPEALKQSVRSDTYRGLYVAKGLPEQTLMEVLLDPAEVALELGL